MQKKLTEVFMCYGILFLVIIRIRLLEPVLIHTKKICLASYHIQFSMNIKIYNHKIETSFFSPEVPKARA